MSGDDAGGGGRDDAAPDGDFSERLKRLQAQVGRQGRSAASGPGPRAGGASPIGQAMRLSSEFIGGVVVGGALGFGFDWLLGTRPWGLMAFLMLGMVTGIYNVMRASGFLGPSVGAVKRKKDPEGS